jgi:hypothetical protein
MINCNIPIDAVIPIMCNENLKVGTNQSIFFHGKLMNCKILSKHLDNEPYFGDYIVRVLEYPAKKVIK